MGKRLIITEEEKKQIRKSYGLTESTPELDAFPIAGGRYNIGYDKNWDDFSNPQNTANSDFSKKATGFGVGGHKKGHIGIDIFGPKGTPILAPVSGKVRYAGNGKTIVIEDPETGYSHWLGHLDSRTVDKGEFVFAGQQVGTLGNSGNAGSTAPHLHYNIFKTSSGFSSGENPIESLKKAIGKDGKDIEDMDYESLGAKFKKEFEKYIKDDEKNKDGDVEAVDAESLWDKMKKAGTVFFDKISKFFD